MDKEYVKSFSSETAFSYYLSSINQKTEQQKMLESNLHSLYKDDSLVDVCDLCCGSGSVSYHLSELFPSWRFELIDLSVAAKEVVATLPRPMSFTLGSAYETPYKAESFDLAICWNSLLHLDSPRLIFEEASRILRPSGVLIVSTLVNTYHNTDILAKVVDHDDQSHITQFGSPRQYTRNTYSLKSLQDFMGDHFRIRKVERFDITKTLDKRPRGIGTYTIPTKDSHLLQVSGGYLMNWAYVEFIKQ